LSSAAHPNISLNQHYTTLLPSTRSTQEEQFDGRSRSLNPIPHFSI
jgi:hypothetical protein